jgi:N-acetylmuramic acid 6-phosphate (MurNAc-6-P) etherase
MEASGADVAESTRALRQSGHNLAIALIMLRSGASARQAKHLLRDTHGHVYNALNQAKAIARGSHNPHG